MLVALFALIAMGSFLVFDGPEAEEASAGPTRPDDARIDPRTLAAARAKLRRAGHMVVENLASTRAEGELLVLEYDAARPVPKLALKHDDAGGFSRLYAGGRLVLEVVNRPGEPRLALDEIRLTAR